MAVTCDVKVSVFNAVKYSPMPEEILISSKDTARCCSHVITAEIKDKGASQVWQVWE
jgi:hypothetical protein